MGSKRVHAIVEGRVQGVYFRAYTQEEAQRLKLAGWVRNRQDGTVETVFEGEAEAVDRMVGWLRQGSPMSQVTDVRITEEEPIGDMGNFEIHYY